MGKRLVVCCDGTWSTPDKARDGIDATTNVVRVAEGALAAGRPAGRLSGLADGCAVGSCVVPGGVTQSVCYCPGVGTGRFDQLRGGVFGWGLSRNIKNAYAFLIEHYEPGDDIFLFGFSRGAYTVRSLAGLVRNSGILRKEAAARLDEAYGLYRRRLSFAPRPVDALLRRWRQRSRRRGASSPLSKATAAVLWRGWRRYVRFRERRAAHPESALARAFRERFAHEARIRFIGVWDTVGALGIPEFLPLPGRLLNRRWMFHDVTLSSSVDNAFQALAIDERRRPFSPTLWRPPASGVGEGRRLEQAWFAGDHGDVGGGHADPDRGLADLALVWMAGKARECGLALDIPARPDPLGRMHDSLSFFYTLLGESPRDIVGEGWRGLHPGVMERYRDGAAGYCPGNLVRYLSRTDGRAQP